jgi:hypothetical protein
LTIFLSNLEVPGIQLTKNYAGRLMMITLNALINKMGQMLGLFTKLRAFRYGSNKRDEELWTPEYLDLINYKRNNIGYGK